MSFEPEQMTVETMEKLMNCAYNDITFKNAILCALDWCNWHHCVYLHKDSKIPVDEDGYRVNKYQQAEKNAKAHKGIYQKTNDRSVQEGKAYFRKNDSGKFVKVDPSEFPQPVDPWGLDWYEYVNPSDNDHLWYEKSNIQYEYTEISENTISYLNNPYESEWYEYVDNEYVRARDSVPQGTITQVQTIHSYDSPRDLEWLEYRSETYQKVNVESYYNPAELGWYERHDGGSDWVYTLTEDTFYDTTKTYYVHWLNPDSYMEFSVDPASEDWYEYNTTSGQFEETYDHELTSNKDYYVLVEDSYTISYDISPVTGKAYYICDYVPYYKRIEQKVVTYTLTTDTVVDPSKKYYYVQNDVVWKELPDYSDHYVRNVDISVMGIENEVTLNYKRPVV